MRNPYSTSPSRPVPAARAPALDPPTVPSRRRVPTLALDMAEACEAIGVADATLRDMIRRGVVPAIQVGRRWLVPVDALRQRLADLALAEANKKGRRGADDAADDDAAADREEGGRGC